MMNFSRINLRVFSILFFIQSLYLSKSEIHWANKVISYSSQLGSKQYSALQAIGEPNVLPNFGLSPCSWTPRNIRRKEEEFIHLGFSKPIRVKTIIANLNNSPNCISKIYFFDTAKNKYLVFQKNINKYPKDKGILFKLIIDKTSYEVSSILIYFRTEMLTDFLQVDAVGISENDETSFEIKINEIQISQSEFKKPTNLGPKVNSPYRELAPIVTADGHKLFFTREGHPSNFGQMKRQDIWYAELNDNGEFENPIIMPPPINNENHNFAFGISIDGTRILLGNVYKEDGSMEKGISISSFNVQEWEYPKKVEIEDFENFNEKTSIFLAPNSKILILSIEGSDSYGGLDLYVSFLKDNGEWSKPKNLGPMINTADDDTSPFLAYDGETLYFSSGGYPGYGSLDIFVSHRLDSTWSNWSKPVNLGQFINSTSWDAYFTIPASGDYAYFVSTNDSYGNEDIFKVFLPKLLQPKPVVLISGRVLNKKNNKPLEATIQYETLPNGRIIGIARSNPLNGEYRIVLPGGFKYGFLAKADSFMSINENIDIRNDLRYQEVSKDLYLVPIEVGESIRLNNIFFEYNDYKLLPDSYSELNRLVKLMKDNPTLVVEISGHTDSIGSSYYNINLSLKRAQEVASYLIANGIDKNRLLIRGFGEKFPIQSNETEDGRKMNRRVEFRILKR